MTRTRSTTLAKHAALALLTLSPLTLTGCLIGQRSRTSISGSYVQPSDLSQVRLNHATPSDVLNALGSPSSKRVEDDGCELWTWNWTKRESGSGHVFLIFRGSSSKRIDQSAHVRFENGVAVEKWRD